MMHDQPCTYNRQTLHISEVLRMADVIVDSHKANELKLYVTIQKQQRQVCGLPAEGHEGKSPTSLMPFMADSQP